MPRPSSWLLAAACLLQCLCAAAPLSALRVGPCTAPSCSRARGAARRLLQQGSMPPPPSNVPLDGAAAPPPPPANSSALPVGGSSSNDIPSTTAVVAGVVGGLGGLTVVLAGALLIASGIIQRWFEGWAQLGGSDKGTSSPRNPSKIYAASLPSTARAAGAGALSSPFATGEPWRLAPAGITPHSSAESRAGAPVGGLGAATPRSLFSGGALSQGWEPQSPATPQSTLSAMGSLVSDAAWRECLIDPAKIQILRRPNGAPWRLGGGSYGQVYKALYDDVQVVAVKLLPGINQSVQLEAVLREGRILRDCRDRNVVQFVGAAFDPTSDQAMLVTEYMEAGDLFRALRWRDERGRRVFGWYRRGGKAALDIARGLHHLHSRHLVHLDLKSANCLLARDGTAKLADVGLAKALPQGYLSAVSNMGTFAWAAPEVLTGQKCDESADIFSYGVLLWEIMTGEAPSRGTMRDIKVPEECLEEVQQLCDRCMSAAPRSRPTAKEIVVLLERYVNGTGVDRSRTLSSTLQLPSGLSSFSAAGTPQFAGPGGEEAQQQQPPPEPSPARTNSTYAVASLYGGPSTHEEEEEARLVAEFSARDSGPHEGPIGPSPIGPSPIGSHGGFGGGNSYGDGGRGSTPELYLGLGERPPLAGLGLGSGSSSASSAGREDGSSELKLVPLPVPEAPHSTWAAAAAKQPGQPGQQLWGRAASSPLGVPTPRGHDGDSQGIRLSSPGSAGSDPFGSAVSAATPQHAQRAGRTQQKQHGEQHVGQQQQQQQPPEEEGTFDPAGSDRAAGDGTEDGLAPLPALAPLRRGLSHRLSSPFMDFQGGPSFRLSNPFK